MSDLLSLPRRSIKGYGWRPDLPDFRDLRVEDVLAELSMVPRGLSKFSLRDAEPEPSYDQGQLGSCTGQGIAFCVQFARAKQGLDAFRPSRLAIYYGERLMEGTVHSDSGAMIRDGMKVVARTGAAPESFWPYDIAKFDQQPPAEYFAAAQTDQVLKYLRAPRSLDSIKRLIYNHIPVVFGFSVYDSFESTEVARTGIMPMPQRNEELLGGHCTVFVGWDDSLVPGNTSEPGVLEARNSWSPNWGDDGHFWMPNAISQERSMSSDFWTVRVVEQPVAA